VIRKMKFLRHIWKAIKYWIAQNLIEIFIILFLGYLGLDVMGNFSEQTLFIESLQSVALGIGIKTALFIIPYSLLFYVLSKSNVFIKVKNPFKYSLLNLILSFGIILLIGILKPQGISIVILPSVASLLSSVIIILRKRIKGNSDKSGNATNWEKV